MHVSKEDGIRICDSVSASMRSARANLTEPDFDVIRQSVVTVIVTRLCVMSSPPESFTKYVNRTAKLEVTKALKRHRARLRREPTHEEISPEDHHQPVDTLTHRELDNAIRAELSTLSKRERDAILSFVGELDSRPNYRLKDIAISKLRTQLSKRGLI